MSPTAQPPTSSNIFSGAGGGAVSQGPSRHRAVSSEASQADTGWSRDTAQLKQPAVLTAAASSYRPPTGSPLAAGGEAAIPDRGGCAFRLK